MSRLPSRGIEFRVERAVSLRCVCPSPSGGSAMKQRIAIVTGGGDCPGLNAVIRAVVRSADRRGWETLGIIGGYEGLLPPGNLRVLDCQAVAGLLSRGGTILGTANRGKFSAMVGYGERR